MQSQSVEEIIFLIVEVEKEAAAFYTKLAGQVIVGAVRDVFWALVADETRHQADFVAMIDKLPLQARKIDSSIDLVQSLSSVVGRLKHAQRGSELVDMSEIDLRQAINIGIHNESEAIKIYSELLAIKQPDFVQLLQRIIAEEEKHLARLQALKEDRLG